MPLLLFCSSSSLKHIFSPAESFLLICCCFSKTRQFSAINQTKFGQIDVKCKMRSQQAFFFFFPEAGPVLHYLLRKQVIMMLPPTKKKIHGDDYSFLTCFKVGYYKQIWAHTKFSISTTCNEATSLCLLCLHKSKRLAETENCVCMFSILTLYENIKVRMGIKGYHIYYGICFYYRHCFVCFTDII